MKPSIGSFGRGVRGWPGEFDVESAADDTGDVRVARVEFAGCLNEAIVEFFGDADLDGDLRMTHRVCLLKEV